MPGSQSVGTDSGATASGTKLATWSLFLFLSLSRCNAKTSHRCRVSPFTGRHTAAPISASDDDDDDGWSEAEAATVVVKALRHATTTPSLLLSLVESEILLCSTHVPIPRLQP
ncbi:hypothetical protein ACLKA7_014842 [Drosophila subpalustris]